MARGRQELKIVVEGLELDMFVARLDRPWLGTSFPFQGFKLQTEADLKLLHRICTHVYVDVDAGRAPNPRFIEREGALIRKARAGEQVAGLRRVTWINQGTLEDELPHAQTAHTLLQRGISEVADDLRNGRDLDLDKLTGGIDAMIESITRYPSAFIWLKELKKKHSDAYQHALGSSVWAATFGRNLGLERADLGELALAGLLCDIGKIRIRPELLSRAGGLDPAEMIEVRQHVQEGLDILAKAPGLPHTVLDAVATHHERHDGSGYPHGLQGIEIPMFGRIMGIIDSYDAMTSPRPHAAARAPHDAVMELYEARDTLYQSELVEQFIQTCGIYPAGSLVELSDGRVGVVTEVHALKRLRPSLMLLLDEDKQRLPEFHPLDMGMTFEDAHGRPLTVKCSLSTGSYGVDNFELFLD